jgi:hypothetical protein
MQRGGSAGPASPRGLLRAGRDRHGPDGEGPGSPQGIARALQRTKHRSLRHQARSHKPHHFSCLALLSAALRASEP